MPGGLKGDLVPAFDAIRIQDVLFDMADIAVILGKPSVVHLAVVALRVFGLDDQVRVLVIALVVLIKQLAVLLLLLFGLLEQLEVRVILLILLVFRPGRFRHLDRQAQGLSVEDADVVQTDADIGLPVVGVAVAVPLEVLHLLLILMFLSWALRQDLVALTLLLIALPVELPHLGRLFNWWLVEA